MRIEATTEKPFATDADTIAVGIFADESPDRPELQVLLDSGEAKTTFRHLAVSHVDDRRIIVAGLGRRSEFDAERARVIAGLAGRRARELATRALCWGLPAPGSEIAEGLVQGTVLGAYRFDRYKPRGPDEPFDRLIVAADEDLAAPVGRAALLAAAQNRARELVDTPANELTPTALADYARQLANRHDLIAFNSLDGDQIRELGMGAFTAVAQGSDQDPRLIALSYEPPSPTDPARRLA
ncbi:MAG: M17 family peptidase N-terminal domain-containing protein, partial [Solirubrobacteraceae bacterium]